MAPDLPHLTKLCYEKGDIDDFVLVIRLYIQGVHVVVYGEETEQEK